MHTRFFYSAFRCRVAAFLATSIWGSVVVLNCHGTDSPDSLPLRIGQFPQQVHTAFDQADGLPSSDVLQIARNREGRIYALTEKGVARFEASRWQTLDADAAAQIKATLFSPEIAWYDTLAEHVSSRQMIRAVAEHDGEIAVAAENGLYLGDGKTWTLALPREGPIRWAPLDVRAVAYDVDGNLWFASPQGVGLRVRSGAWKLFTGADGLPYNDFTCMAAGSKGVWFGTTNGAIRYHGGNWEFRQGRRWLAHNHVRDIVIGDDGAAWFATPGGVSRIGFRSTTLSQKAAFYEDEIEKYHRRTSFGYVNPADLAVAGDKSTAVPVYSDNDGFNTGLYLAAVSQAYA